MMRLLVIWRSGFRLPVLLALSVLLLGCGAGDTATQASNPISSFATTCGKWSLVKSPSIGGGQGTGLYSVSALSATDAWAVGDDYPSSNSELALIEHWNGKTWKVVKSPSPGPNGNTLNGVAAVSANNVWAVGYYHASSGATHTLIERWDGANWNVVPSANPGADDSLFGVAALSGHSSVWAVGNTNTGTTLTEATC